MREQWLDMELLDNVVLSASSATEGGHKCLDYLPGSVLLGAVAAKMYKDLGPELLLSGKIRFHNGLPLSEGGQLGFPMPLSYQRFKEDQTGTLLDGLRITDNEAEGWAREGKVVQPWRGGAVTLSGETFKARQHNTMKGAIDRDKFGISSESQLFDYQFLARGQRFITKVQVDDSVTEPQFKQIITALTAAPIHLGRSRSAEFSRVKATTADPFALPSIKPLDGKQITFYLVNDLALYRQGIPSLTPTPADFHLPGEALVIWDKCFIRTRRYAPWNRFRNCRDPERQVLARGSVITFELPDNHEIAPDEVDNKLAVGIGAYRQDGLGWVFCQPDFVVAPVKTLAETRAWSPHDGRTPTDLTDPASQLLAGFLKSQQPRRKDETPQEIGSKWAKEWWRLQKKLKDISDETPGKSQWSQIRGFAEHAATRAELVSQINNFCGHAMRQRYWQGAMVKDGGRLLSLHQAINTKISDTADDTVAVEALAIEALMHAAREMAQRISREETKGEQNGQE